MREFALGTALEDLMELDVYRVDLITPPGDTAANPNIKIQVSKDKIGVNKIETIEMETLLLSMF